MTAGPLGRLLKHDPQSLNFQAERAPALVTTQHKRTRHAFNQGELGMCTGCAITGLLDTEPWTHHYLSERTALRFYKWATANDDFAGAYPPDDTGTSGLDIAKAAQHYELIGSYTHAFGLQHALEALVVRPVITGVDWYDSFDEPGPNGLVEISPDASVRGGHEIEVLGIDVEAQTIRCINSWGSDWGDSGRFTMSWATWDQLLTSDGDVTTAAPA